MSFTMSSTTTATLARAARRGVTLIEAILFISIALGLIVGGIVFYNQANTASTTNEAARNINALASSVRSLYPSDFSSITVASMITANGVPASLINGSAIRNEFGGAYTIAVDPGNANQFFILTSSVPDAVCARLGVFSGGQGIVGTGIAEIRAYDNAATPAAVGDAFTGTLADAATKCAANNASALRILFTR
jgi:hypothetical protein